MKKIIGIWAALLAFAGFSILGLSSCNVAESDDSLVLRLRLDDSLSIERGVFKTVDIDLFDGNGVMTHPDVFNGPYRLQDAEKLANLAVTTKIPDPVTIRVTAYKAADDYWVFTITLNNGTRIAANPIHVEPVVPVIPNPADTLTPVRIIITNPATPVLYVGDPSVSLSARAELANASQDVTWSVASGDAAVLETGDKLKAVKAGIVILKASSTRAPSVFATMELTIKEAPVELPKSVVIGNPSPLLLTVGGASISLAASVLPVEAKQDIKWTMPSNTVAVLEQGNVVKGLAAGTVTLTASSVIAPSVFDTLVVNVQNPPAKLPIQIILKNPSLTLLVGAPPVALEATVEPSDASPGLIWTSDAPGVAEIVNNNQIKGLKSGSAKVTATSEVKSSVTAVLNVSVEAPVVVPESLSLRMPTPMTLAVGGADGEILWKVAPVGSDTGVEWLSSDSTVAKIIDGNKVRPLKKGPARITGKSKVKSTVTAAFDVNVIVPVKVDAINMLPKSMTLYTGGADSQLTVVMTGNDTGAHYVLTSSNSLIASVTATGSVKGLTAGSVAITASVLGYSAISSVCSVFVVKDPPVVTVSPNQSIAFNGEALFTVSVAPQAYGKTVEIKADMDGDNIFEQTVLNKETAEFKKIYTEVKSTTVSFKVKDTEGNEETVTRKVTVGAPGAPMVSIVNPSKDTAINVLSFKIRFTVKDTAQKIDTFVDSTVTLIVGSNKVRAARTNAGGEGSDEVTILVDNTAPAVAIGGAATQTTGVAAFALAGTASDLGSGLQSVNITGALSGNGFATITAGDWSKGGLTLAEGANTLVATALDKAGNAKTASITVTLDSKKPGVPVVTAPAAVRAGPIKWTWVKANTDGSGRFKVKIDGGPEIDATLAEYSLATLVDGTTYGLSVKETDPIAGDGPWSTEKKVLYDTKKPSPGISVTATPTRTPEWKWASNGGVGTFRWHYKGQAAGSAGTGAGLTFAPTTLATGTYNLCVQEKDSPEWGDEWGTENCASLDVDKKGPDIGSIQYPDGYVTNQTSISISFTADLVAKPPLVCPLSLEGENSCTLTASDALGNPTSVVRKIWRRSNVVFVRVGGSGNGNGSSFDNAYGSLWQAINNLAANKNQIWMMEGNYNIDEVQPPYMRSGTTIYGGFSDAKNQSSEADRNLASDITLVSTKGTQPDGGSAFAILQVKTQDGSPISDITLDGLRFKPGYYGLLVAEADNITLNDCVFSSPGAAGLMSMDNSAVTFNDCRFEGNQTSDMLQISGKTVTFNRCTWKDNLSVPGAFVIYKGKVVVNNSTFQNSANFAGEFPNRWIVVYTDDLANDLDIYGSTIQGLGGNPGPAVTENFDTYFFGGTGNRAP